MDMGVHIMAFGLVCVYLSCSHSNTGFGDAPFSDKNFFFTSFLSFEMSSSDSPLSSSIFIISSTIMFQYARTLFSNRTIFLSFY